MQIKINKNLSIGNNIKPLIIAEISANHCGSKKKFINHILQAKKFGADLVKIQTYEAQDMVVDKKFKIKKGLWKNKNLWKLYQKAQTPYEWHFDAFKIAKKNKIELFSTPFSVRALKFLKKFKPNLYKISSFELTDINLITEIAKLKKPIIISTGLSNIKEIKKAVQTIKKWHKKIIILYCVSSYPAKLEEINFKKIEYIKKATGIKNVGFSDHTKGITSSLASISHGSCVVEKHFKVGNNDSPDSTFSINKNELKNLNREVKKLSLIYNENLSLEKKQSLFFRRSVYAIKNIKKNEKFTRDNIACYRPMTGICASKYFELLGKKAQKNIRKYSALKKNAL